ncbi:MAG: radical SAM protein [Deltaproteobacteria bacterium]|nr:MAG: radical SAM protein [Deltaproteobacteria bacterium]
MELEEREIKKIVFVEPSSPDYHIFNRYPLPRLGTIILGTILQNNGYKVKVFIEDIKELDFAEIFSADLVCISTITSTAPRAYEVARQVKNYGIPVAMGGPHPSALPEDALGHCDFVLRGEAEQTILDFVHALASGKGYEEVKGLSFIKEGEIYHNEIPPFYHDLDTLPFPNFSLIQGYHKYKNAKKLIPKITPVLTSRGCPNDCHFCSVTKMFGRKYRFRSNENVMEELRQLELGYIFFYDDNFTASPKRTKELLRSMINERLCPDWSAQVCIDIGRDRELLDLMKRSNCHNCYIGLESINPDTLKAFNKKQTLEGMKECLTQLKRRGIRVHGMFVFGSDEDSVDTIRQTVKFATKNRIDTIQFMILTPLPGTKFYYDLDSQGRLVSRDWSLYDAHHVVYEPKKMTFFDLQFETFKAMAKFYSWRQVLKRLAKFDFYNSMLKAYGNRVIKKWKKKNKYFVELTKEFTSDAGKRIEIAARKTAEDIKERVRQFHAREKLSQLYRSNEGAPNRPAQEDPDS